LGWIDAALRALRVTRSPERDRLRIRNVYFGLQIRTVRYTGSVRPRGVVFVVDHGIDRTGPLRPAVSARLQQQNATRAYTAEVMKAEGMGATDRGSRSETAFDRGDLAGASMSRQDSTG
jgi:hypothetical protein